MADAALDAAVLTDEDKQKVHAFITLTDDRACTSSQN